MINYDPHDYRSVDRGYQNVETASAFAKFVYDDLLKNYPDIAGKKVLLLGMDNSSTYLSAHLKILLPDLIFISGDKTNNSLSGVGEMEADFSVFIDDYFGGGSSTRKLFKTIEKPAYSAEMGNELRLYYIDSQSKKYAMIKRIGKRQMPYFIEVMYPQ